MRKGRWMTTCRACHDGGCAATVMAEIRSLQWAPSEQPANCGRSARNTWKQTLGRLKLASAALSIFLAGAG